MTSANCLFCQIVTRSRPSDIVGEAEGLVAVADINPQAPTHLVIMPLEHIPTLTDVTEAHTNLLGTMLSFAVRLAREHHLAAGYRVVINCGPQAGQSIWHLHAHLLGGRPLGWPPG